MKKRISEKEALFCLYYSLNRDARSAAAKAGYLRAPERAAGKLLEKKAVREEIQKREEERALSDPEICAGYRRLAFGSITDALRLMTQQDTLTAEDLEQMDFFNVSDIKCPKSGGLEIKFFDRLKALDRLTEMSGKREGQGFQSFFHALDKSASALEKQANASQAKREEGD